MSTIRFTLGQQALIKLRDDGSCKYIKDGQEYEICIDDDLQGESIFVEVFDWEEDEEDFQAVETEDQPDSENSSPEFYPKPDKKDYS